MIFWFVILLFAIAIAKFMHGAFDQNQSKAKLQKVQKRLAQLEAKAAEKEETNTKQ